MTDAPLTRRERRAKLRATTERVLSPAFRRWAYGVTAAALGYAAVVGWIRPEYATAAAPLIMAAFYVDKSGEPR